MSAVRARALAVHPEDVEIAFPPIESGGRVAVGAAQLLLDASQNPCFEWAQILLAAPQLRRRRVRGPEETRDKWRSAAVRPPTESGKEPFTTRSKLHRCLVCCAA